MYFHEVKPPAVKGWSSEWTLKKEITTPRCVNHKVAAWGHNDDLYLIFQLLKKKACRFSAIHISFTYGYKMKQFHSSMGWRCMIC